MLEQTEEIEETNKCNICGEEMETTESIHADTRIPIFFVKEFKTRRSTQCITKMPYLYGKDTLWAMDAKGSTVLRIEYEPVKFCSPEFYSALSNSFLAKYNECLEDLEPSAYKDTPYWAEWCKKVISDYKEFDTINF